MKKYDAPTRGLRIIRRKLTFVRSLCACDGWVRAYARVRCVRLQMVWFYSVLFVIPTGLAFLLTGGKTQLSREELLQSQAAKAKLRENFGDEAEERRREMKAMMKKVLFENRDDMSDMRPEWAKKRDAKRQREQEAAAAKQREAAAA